MVASSTETERNQLPPDREERIVFKGARDHVRMIIPETMEEQLLIHEIVSMHSKTSEILGGTGVVLDFQGRKIGEDGLSRFIQALWRSGMRVLSWITYDLETQNLLKSAGVHVGEYRAPVSREAGSSAPPLALAHSLRSGQRESSMTAISLLSDTSTTGRRSLPGAASWSGDDSRGSRTRD